jgi:hypothetical protein
MRFLRACQQGIELLQIRRVHNDVRRGRKVGTRRRQCDHVRGGERRRTGQQDPQRVVDGGFAGPGRVLQDLQVVPGADPFVAAVAEAVEREAEPGRREQVFAVGVVRERPRLADQRVDDVSVMHRRPVPAHQPRQRVDESIGVPDLDPVGEQPGLDPFADQPAMHRVRIALKVNQAAGVDAAGHFQARRHPLIGEGLERRHLLGEAVPTAGVAGRHDLAEEPVVLAAVGEVPAAAEEQRLIDRRLEVPVRRLRIAVLVRLPGVDPLTRHAVVGQQVPVPRLELPRRRQVVHRRRQRIAAVLPGHPAQVPERLLQPVRQRLERLRRTHRHRLPVRIRQDEVVDQVVERLPGDRDGQPVHGREIRRREVAGPVHLTEHHRLPRSRGRPPPPHPPLEGPTVRIAELARVFPTQPVEQRLGEQPRLGPQSLLHRRPDRRERIHPRPVRAGRLPRTRQRPVVAIMSGRLLAHPCSPGRQGQRRSHFEVAVQPPNLAIRNHRIPPNLRELRSWPDYQKEGILIVAGWGKTIAATHRCQTS